MDEASACGAGDCRFESCRGHFLFLGLISKELCNVASLAATMATGMPVIGIRGCDLGNNWKQRAFAEARAAIAQLGERQTEDLKVPGSIPGLGILLRTGRVFVDSHMLSTCIGGSRGGRGLIGWLGGGPLQTTGCLA